VTEKTLYAPGTPCWVDLGSRDVPESVRFYSGLFGWEHVEADDPGRTGGYGFFLKSGKRVAGIGPNQADRPPAWTTYVTTHDAQATARKVRQAGGQVLVEPLDVIEAGQMAAFLDPTGAAINAWQPNTHIGAEIVDEPGAVAWSELNTSDPIAAKAFYSAVFGWDARDRDMGETGTYTQWMLGEDMIGGMLDMRGRGPDEVPAHWMTYFTVEDCDAAAERATGQGGKLMAGPTDVPFGRIAPLSDPHGAVFSAFERVTVGP
jgi:predicted enzyme related to lactoylglutathione lyase